MNGLRLSTRITAAAMIMVLITGAALMYVEKTYIRDVFMNKQRADLEKALATENIRINQGITNLREHAVFLSNTPPVSGIVRASLNRGYDALESETRARWEARLKQVFSSFLRAHPDYYRIRFIGVADDGLEIVHVERKEGSIETEPQGGLHHVADRDYFIDTLSLREGQVHISEFNLMHEHGAIVLLPKPTLRASVPVFSPDGKIFGMLVINMDVDKLFNSATLGIPHGFQAYISNSDGYYLLHPDHRRAFKFGLDKEDGLFAEFPVLESMRDPKAADYLSMQAIAGDTGIHYLSAMRVHFDPDNPSRFLLLANGISSEMLEQLIPAIPADRIAVEIIAILLIGWIALLALRRTFAPLDQIADAANRIAAGEQNIKLPQASSGEIGSLTNALNTMIQKMEQRETEIRMINAELEDRVEERTHELLHAKHMAESANRVKSEFLAKMSHDIRTPMNSILGMASLALNLATDARCSKYLMNIQSSGEHLLGIIDDLLDFSKLDAGKMNIDIVDFDLRHMLDDVSAMVSGRVAAKGLEFVIEIDAGIDANLCGDPHRITQILVNFASNAVKFTDKGRITLRVRKISEDKTSCLVCFEMHDTGIGIDAAGKARLFQPFLQLDNSSTREKEGSGLGLAICRQLAEMMPDGEVGVESAIGQGSTFWFRVRLGKADKCGFKNEIPDMSPAMQAALDGARILLAEDNLFNQQVAAGFLENAGVTVCIARNGKEAIDLLRTDDFDCVLMDMQMPELDRLDATRMIRANPDLAGLPVIALTANVTEENRERCLAAGMNDFIGKPFKPYDFYAAIARCLSGKPRQAAALAVIETPVHGTEVIDLSILEGICGGDRLKMRELALKFQASARLDMTRIEAALECNDMTALAALGHHIKGAAGMMGARRLADLCKMLEICSEDEGSMELIQDIVVNIRILLDRIDEQVADMTAPAIPGRMLE